ncbi:MAG: hypothetical protein KAS32_01640 [Candidatus Peribacteraceae bacterium]|nr:hypothetical protein [Candidatus Peribacteraceae bacterium]
MLRSLKNLKIRELVQYFPSTSFSSDTLEESIPLEQWDQIIFDLDTDPVLFDAYKKSYNFRNSGYSAAEHSTRDLLKLFFANRNSPNVNYSTLRKILSERGSTRIAILNAHGKGSDGSWVYSANGNVSHVQQWIVDTNAKNSRARSKYAALLIACCNKDAIDPDQGDIPIFYPKGVLGNSYKHETCFLGSK